jgi:predicted RNA binding protein YcfA (HicA-like mRNA interferase family)
MSNFPAVSFNELIKFVESIGFIAVRQKGSHIRYAHPDGRKTTVPDHGNKDVPIGLLSKIIKIDIGLSLKDFFELI